MPDDDYYRGRSGMKTWTATAAAAAIWVWATGAAIADEWQRAKAPIESRWAAEVKPEQAWPEYPRPQMVRPEWTNLNGLWECVITPGEAERPQEFDRRILVPFPLESALSGVRGRLLPEQRLWYRRQFETPAPQPGGRVLLHFGAVDWEAEVWLNEQRLGVHRGGYTPFSFDITDALAPNGPQTLIVAVRDPTDAGTQPRGKQVLKPHGIWYTPTSGIWQTVWLESVPQTYIESLHIVARFDEKAVEVTAFTPNAGENAVIAVTARDGEREVAAAKGTPGKPMRLSLPAVHAWTPDDPFLYDLDIALLVNDQPADRVASYFGMRKIAVAPDEAGTPRLMLNNKPLFHYGVLDQGFWPAGLYTPPTDAALRYDLEVLKSLGFNTVRKHVKVEPVRWYYWCDKLGLLVWQDMPSGDRYIGPQDQDLERTAESDRQFRTELREMIDLLRNHPSIIMWVAFNEGWGQYQTAEIARWTREYDPTRLVNSASGWTDRGVGDVHDIHAYPGPAMPAVEPQRAAVLGEFGGLGLPLSGHTWQEERNWGYRSYENREALTEAYVGLLTRLRPLISQGLCAAIYTQTSDVETEVNGLLTYDRAVLKLDAERAAAAARRLYLPPPRIETITPTSEAQAQTWRFTTEQPSDGWTATDFDDSGWHAAPGGFGRAGTPGAVVRTEWTSDEIWLRRTFEVEAAPDGEVYLRIHHDEDAEVYLNGQRVAELKGYTTSYVFAPLDRGGAPPLRRGTNTLAVHCRQTRGGQYIDVGLVEVIESAK